MVVPNIDTVPTIIPLPPLPEMIKEAVNEGRLAIFAGAGVSRLLGCMGWDGLARNLVDTCHREGLISFKEQEALLRESDHRKTITICKHVLVQREGRAELFYEKVEAALRVDEALASEYPIYEELYRLRAAAFITTNVDTHCDGPFLDSNVVYRPENLPTGVIDSARIYHIHGSIRDSKTLVFSVQDYLRRYNMSGVRAFLQRVFLEYTVLFVGYGLAELQLLELVFPGEPNSSALNHVLLMPFYRGEERILSFECEYYRELGIEVIAYEKDERGYYQLYDVIKQWSRQINIVTPFVPQAYEEIERLVNEYGDEKAARLFQMIQNDPPLEDHFFKVVSDPQWLVPLKEKGYFDPRKNPRPYQAKGEQGYSIPRWSILGYLERVSRQLDPGSPSIGTTLMEVVREIADFRDDEGERIDNYQTDYMVTKVLANVARS